ncbi:MAG: glycosyltransferase family 4 protein [Gemmatimonadota bacterium]
MVRKGERARWLPWLHPIGAFIVSRWTRSAQRAGSPSASAHPPEGVLRIGIDLASWSDPRGYGRFTRGIVNALLASETRHDFVTYVDATTAREHRLPAGAQVVTVETAEAPTRAASASGRRRLGDLRAMARAVGATRPDVLLFPTVYTWFPVWTRCVVVVGIHDVIAEQYPELVFPERRRRRLWNLKSRLARWQADYVMTVSRYAARGIVERLGWPGDRLWVVEEAPDPVFRPLSPAEIRSDVLKRCGIGAEQPFLLYVGGVNPHKNLPLFAEALAGVRSEGADLRLVIVGDIEGDRFTPGIAELRARLGTLRLDSAVTFAGRLEDADLVHLLNAARAVVLPSRSEGFGLPAVEGAACGTPALATRNSPLPELLQGGGIFFDPADRRAMEVALRRILDPGERARMGRAALEAVRHLGWDRSARHLLDRLDSLTPLARPAR